MFPDLEAGFGGGCQVEKVKHLLIVDLHVANLDLGLVLGPRQRLNPLKEVVAQPRYYARLALVPVLSRRVKIDRIPNVFGF